MWCSLLTVSGCPWASSNQDSVIIPLLPNAQHTATFSALTLWYWCSWGWAQECIFCLFMWPVTTMVEIYLVTEKYEVQYGGSSQTLLSTTQIWICWTGRYPCLKQHMIKIIVVWMIFSSKLLSSFSLSAISSFLKYLCYRQTKTSSGNGENIQLRLRSPWRNPFFDPLQPMFGSDPCFGNRCCMETGEDLKVHHVHIWTHWNICLMGQPSCEFP